MIFGNWLSRRRLSPVARDWDSHAQLGRNHGIVITGTGPSESLVMDSFAALDGEGRRGQKINIAPELKEVTQYTKTLIAFAAPAAAAAAKNTSK